MYGNCFLRCEGKKIATSVKTNDLEQQTAGSLEVPAGKQHETDHKLCLITNNTVTIPSCHIFITPLKAINHVVSNNIKPNNLIEIEETPFLVIEQLDIVLTPVLQKLGPRMPDIYVAVLWNPHDQAVILKRNMTICYARESDYMEKSPLDQ